MMKVKKQNNKLIRILCAVMFAAFSFIYIYMFQGELLALLQDHLSEGVTRSNTLVTAMVITILLVLLQWLINSVSRLCGRWEALSYIPSCALLALLTDVNDGTILYSANKWLWGVPLCVLLYLGVVWLERMTKHARRRDFFGVLWPNMLTFSLLFVLTSQIGNHAPAPHMELAAWRYMHDDDYEKVLRVGRRSDDYNAELTALRNLAMAKTGQLGERMFHYPQPYGAEGFIFNKYSQQTTSYGASEYYTRLGNEPFGGESGMAFCHRMYAKNDSAIYRDIYLAALLLEKNLPTFVAESAVKNAVGSALPTHYQEALVLYNDLHPSTPVAFTPDSAVVSRFAEFRALEQEHVGNSIVAKNLAKRKFGDTYWFYYDF